MTGKFLDGSKFDPMYQSVISINITNYANVRIHTKEPKLKMSGRTFCCAHLQLVLIKQSVCSMQNGRMRPIVFDQLSYIVVIVFACLGVSLVKRSFQQLFHE